MSFKGVLGRIVEAAGGGIGAVLVDGEGESVEFVTRGRGDSFEIRLAGAQHAVILSLLNDTQKRIGNGNVIQEISVRSNRFTYTIAPVEEDLFVVLIQDTTGIPSMGMKALRDGIPAINELI